MITSERCRALGLDSLGVMTQGSQSLALGLTLAAAPQLVQLARFPEEMSLGKAEFRSKSGQDFLRC